MQIGAVIVYCLLAFCEKRLCVQSYIVLIELWVSACTLVRFQIQNPTAPLSDRDNSNLQSMRKYFSSRTPDGSIPTENLDMKT